jgi:hypothetical protein
VSGSIADWVMAIANVGLAGAAIFAARQGIRSLNAWRTEAVGKRKLELAEEVLADFYQVRDIICDARRPAIFVGEGSTRQKKEWENEHATRMLNAYYAPAERLMNKQDFFAHFFAKQYRFIAFFGPEAAKPYEDIGKIRNEILIAVNMLTMTYPNPQDPQKVGTSQEARQKSQSTIGWPSQGTDEIQKKLDTTVSDIEALCRPIIKATAIAS